MSACSKYLNRFKIALQHRGLPFPNEIIDYMGKRATSDRSLDNIILSVLQIIEPPYCQKRHCPSHTSYGFCGCSKSLIPGKCPLNLEYLRKKREREESIMTKRVAQIPGIYLPLSEHTKGRIFAMSEAQWQQEIKKFPKHLTGKI